MKGKEPQLELRTNHHTVRAAPPAAEHEARVASEPTSPAFVHAMEVAFKSYLLACTNETRFEIRVAGLPPLCFVMKRFGDTALVAGLLRESDGVIECLTICRPGFDDAEDEAALDAAGDLITRGDDRAELREKVQALIDEVRPQPKPLAVHIHFDEVGFDNPSTRIVTHCLAESFFDQFGLEKTLYATDV